MVKKIKKDVLIDKSLNSPTGSEPEPVEVKTESKELDDYLLKIEEVISTLTICRAKWNKGVKDGIYPEPVRFGRRVAWRASDIKRLMDNAGGVTHG